MSPSHPSICSRDGLRAARVKESLTTRPANASINLPSATQTPTAVDGHVSGELTSHARFTRFAKATSRRAGQPAAFLLACGVVIVWVVTGPLFQFSDTWQLVINTGTTVVTFLMVFLIQNTQNRESQAIQVKLDELIRAIDRAQNSLLDLEDLDDAELEALHAKYQAMAQRARSQES